MPYPKITLYRKQNNLCISCGKSKNSNKTLCCESCRFKNNERSKKVRESRKKENQCQYCGKTIKNLKLKSCNNCRKKLAESVKYLTEKRREKGLCKCGEKANIGFVCENCWFKKASLNNTGSRKSWLFIKNLLKLQNFKCSYSGKLLIIGKNASLDHKVPICKNGNKSSISNLQWVDYDINTKMKRHMSHDEFILLLKTIINYTDTMESLVSA